MDNRSNNRSSQPRSAEERRAQFEQMRRNAQQARGESQDSTHQQNSRSAGGATRSRSAQPRTTQPAVRQGRRKMSLITHIQRRTKLFYKILFIAACAVIVLLLVLAVRAKIIAPRINGVITSEEGEVTYYSGSVIDQTYNGLYFIDEEGYYMQNGKSSSETKFLDWNGVTWYIENGKVDRQGGAKLIQEGEGTRYVNNGIFDPTAELVYQDTDGSFYYIKDGLVVPDYNENVAYDGRLYCFLKGKVVNDPLAIDPNKKMVALTFDDGPQTAVTSRILDDLEKVGGRATFFIVGTRISGQEAMLTRAADMGCELANHTWDHAGSLTGYSTSDIRSKISKCNEAIEEVTGKAPTLVRPVGGDVDYKVVAAIDYPMITWDVDSRDWNDATSASVISTIENNVKDGSIVLMHDLYETTATACDTLIPALVSQGYQLVTVDELAFYKGVNLYEGNVYTDCKPKQTDAAPAPKDEEE